MKSLPIALGAMIALAAPSFAQEDPIGIRQALMDSNAAAAGAAAGMMKSEIAYNPVVAKAAISSMHATALAYASFFPEGTSSDDDQRTTAAPAIWADAAAFDAALGEFQADTAAALEAAGREGPADLAAFTAAMEPVLGNCQSCHEDFRIER